MVCLREATLRCAVALTFAYIIHFYTTGSIFLWTIGFSMITLCPTRPVYIRGLMQMVYYYHMIYSPETNNQGKTSGYIHTIVATIYVQNNGHYSQYYILRAWWVLDVALDPSCCPPGSPMGVLSPPILQINCFSCPSLGGPGPPFAPLPSWPHFPQGPRTRSSLRPPHTFWSELSQDP
jgi:hypothetical protein